SSYRSGFRESANVIAHMWRGQGRGNSSLMAIRRPIIRRCESFPRHFISTISNNVSTISDNGGLKMKAFLLAVALTALSAGVASAQPWSRCFDNNSPACTDARNAFAEHHGGKFPEQYYNGWYNGGRGRWYQRDGAWRW